MIKNKIKEILLKKFLFLRKLFLGTGIGKIPGVAPLYRTVFSILKPQDIRKVSLNGFKMYLNFKDIGIVPQILESGVYEKTETQFVKKNVKEGMTILNIGANFGYYTVLHADLVGEKGKVYAFEPEPENFNLLLKNTQENNFKNVELFKIALGKKTETVKLYLDKKNLGNPSLIKNNVPDIDTSIDIDIMTLDDFVSNEKLSSVDFIHMDVQGSEGFVIEGAKNTLERFKPKILMEFWPYGLKNAGTNPEYLLQALGSLGATFKVITEDESLRNVSTQEIIADCESRKGGRGFLNLFIEFC